MTPQKGVIRKGSCQLCKIVFRSQLEPRIVDFDIYCQFHTRTAINDHTLAVQVLERLVQDKKSAQMQEKRRLSNEDELTEAVASSSTRNSANAAAGGKGGHLGKYKTALPQISSKQQFDNGGDNDDDEVVEIEAVEEEVYTSHPILNIAGVKTAKKAAAAGNAGGGGGGGTKGKPLIVPSYMRQKNSKKSKDEVIVKGYVLTADSEYPPEPEPFVLPVTVKARVMDAQEFGQMYAPLKAFMFRPGEENVAAEANADRDYPPLNSPHGGSSRLSISKSASKSQVMQPSLGHIVSSLVFEMLDNVMDDLESERVTEKLLDQVPHFIYTEAAAATAKEDSDDSSNNKGLYEYVISLNFCNNYLIILF